MVDEEPIGEAAGRGLEDADEVAQQGLNRKLIVALERAGHALRTELRGRAQEAGLTLTQAEILLRLASGRLSRQRVGAIAAEFDVRQPTISDAVAALKRKGMLERRANPDDARSSELVLTAKGEEVAVGLESGERTARAIVAALPEHEKSEALKLLIELIAGLNRAGTIQVARTCPTCRFFRPRQGEAPFCALLEMTLNPGDLRVDCPEHEPIHST